MNLNEAVRREIGRLERTKTFKKETVIESEQGAVVRVAGKDAVMLASNNYLGLASDPRIKQAAIRGVRAYVYDLQKKLEADREASYRFGFIATDGVFSMEGDLAPLPALIEISKKYGRILFADDSHAVGVIGATGRGSPEQLGVHGKVDVLSGTLGKALGGASGGYIAGNRDLISYLRQKSRPYTFSNSLPPSIAVAAIEAFTILEQDPSLIERLRQNTAYFRKHIQELGYKILAGEHPIVPVMLGQASVAMDMSDALLEEGVYIKGLWYPVVPKGEARLRAQISAAFDQATLDRALTAFEKVGKRLGVI